MYSVIFKCRTLEYQENIDPHTSFRSTAEKIPFGLVCTVSYLSGDFLRLSDNYRNSLRSDGVVRELKT